MFTFLTLISLAPRTQSYRRQCNHQHPKAHEVCFILQFHFKFKFLFYTNVKTPGKIGIKSRRGEL